MKKEKQKQVISIEEFDKHVSLTNIIPAGNGNSVIRLKKIADALQYDEYHHLTRFPTILIAGKEQGKSTLARAFLNYLCLQIKETDASLFQSYSHITEYFWASHPDRGYLITNIEYLAKIFHKTIFQILRQREYTYLNQSNGCETRYPVDSIVIMTASDILQVPEPILKHIHYKIQQKEYDTNQKILITIQSLNNTGIKYMDDEVVKKMVERTADLDGLIALIRNCIDCLKSDCKNDILKTQHVEQVLSLLSK